MLRKLISVLIVFLLLSCDDEDLSKIEIIYENDFEASDLSNLIGASLYQFEGNTMLGNFNNQKFTLAMNHLGDHKSIMVAFDLYIHDSWDGNVSSIGGPDYWILKVDDLKDDKYSTREFRTTFSNSTCDSELCSYQSFPDEYPSSRSPKSGSTDINVPGSCSLKANFGGTSLYQIEKKFNHRGNAVIIEFYDELLQINSSDPRCDESWSLDNLRIWILKYD